MALAAVDLLDAVKAFFPSAIGGLDDLQVNHRPPPWLPCAAFQYTGISPNDLGEPLPRTSATPLPNIGTDEPPGRHIVRDKPPGTVRPQNLQYRMDNVPLGIFLRSATRFGGRDIWCE
jgi:hypothetical protein